jgi:hypothetical protein
MQETSSDTNDIGGDREALRLERDRLRAQLDACRQDLRQARVELSQAREIQEVLEERLRTGDGAVEESGAADGVPRTQGTRGSDTAWSRKVWRRVTMSPSRRALQQDVQLLHRSELFDPDWYLAQYPDVASAGLDPAEHYLRFGVHEGRDPGPLFNTDAYLRDHPEAVQGGINPLLHFLSSGSGTGA